MDSLPVRCLNMWLCMAILLTCLIQDTLQQYGPWSQWTECSGSCGVPGTHTRARECLAAGGACAEPVFQAGACEGPCPVDGFYEEWGEWSSCTPTCGGVSTKFRERECVGPENGGAPCNGDAMDVGVCTTLPSCPVTTAKYEDDVVATEAPGDKETEGSGTTSSTTSTTTTTNPNPDAKIRTPYWSKDRLDDSVGIVRTRGDHLCWLPFWYRGLKFNACTSKDSDLPWCATNGRTLPSGDLAMNKWEYCGDDAPLEEPDGCPIETLPQEGKPAGRCKRRFKRELSGPEYTRCLFDRDGSPPWCVDTDGNKALCNLNRTVNNGQYDCVFPFVYRYRDGRNQTLHFCTKKNSLRRWCATTAVYHQGSYKNWGYCHIPNCHYEFPDEVGRQYEPGHANTFG